MNYIEPWCLTILANGHIHYCTLIRGPKVSYSQKLAFLSTQIIVKFLSICNLQITKWRWV